MKYHEATIKSLFYNNTKHNENHKPVFQVKIGYLPQHIPKNIAQRNQNEVHKYIYSNSLKLSRKNTYLHYYYQLITNSIPVEDMYL